LTLQTAFAARRCFWFSANDSSIENDCPPLVCTICKEARTVARGAGREKPPLENFSSLLENSVGQNLELSDIVQILRPLSESSSLSLAPQAGYVSERSICEKEALLPKKRIFGTCSL